MRTFQILESTIMYYLSLLYFRLNILSSFNLLAYDCKLSHNHCYLPLESVQLRSLS